METAASSEFLGIVLNSCEMFDWSSSSEWPRHLHHSLINPLYVLIYNLSSWVFIFKMLCFLYFYQKWSVLSFFKRQTTEGRVYHTWRGDLNNSQWAFSPIWAFRAQLHNLPPCSHTKLTEKQKIKQTEGYLVGKWSSLAMKVDEGR